MAFEDEGGPKWDATQFSLDRFNLSTKPEPSSSLLAFGTRVISSLRPDSRNRECNKCQVDNCTADIAAMKEYHTRYKVCETHLKAHQVTKDGISQRFCQQCGRFHPVEEFDGAKRSCRARLSKHNARRRRQREMANMLRTTGKIDKAALCSKYELTPEELEKKLARMERTMKQKSRATGAAQCASTQSGSGRSSGSGSGGAALGLEPMPGVPPITQAELDLLGDNFLEEVLGPLGGMPSTHADINTVPAGATTRTALGEMQPGEGAADFLAINPASVMDLDDVAVLQELSKELGLGATGVDAIAAAAQLGASAASNTSAATAMLNALPSSTSTSEAVQPRQQQQQQQHHHINAHALDGSNMAGNCTLRSAFLPPSQTVKSSAAFPFAPSHATGFAPPPGAATITTGIGSLPPYMRPPPPAVAAAPFSSFVPSGGDQTTALPVALAATNAATVLEEALNLLQYSHSQVKYAAEERLVRLSTKLFGCTPADLPGEIKAPLMAMLASDAAEGYMRPGCVHIETNGMADEVALATLRAGGIRAATERFLEQTAGAAAAQGRTVVLQLGDQMAMVKDGKVLHVLSTAHAGDLLPAVAAVRPLAVVPNATVTTGAAVRTSASTTFSSSSSSSSVSSVELCIWGYHLGRDNDIVLARSRGQHLQADIVDVKRDAAWEDGLQCLTVRVSGNLQPGAMHVEVMRGAYCSASRTVLITPSSHVAAEVCTLEMASTDGADGDAGDNDTLIYELGALVEGAAASELSAGFSLFGSSRGRQLAALSHGPAPPARTARRLVPFALQRCWPNVARMALALATADATSPERALQAMNDASMKHTGLALLAIAVRTQTPRLLDVLISWARAHKVELRADVPGRRGLTALHLAALIPDGGTTAATLSSACPDALRGWDGARAEDGSTPLALATRLGTAPDLERVIARAQFANGGSIGMVGKGSGDGSPGAAAAAAAIATDGGPTASTLRNLRSTTWQDSGMVGPAGPTSSDDDVASSKSSVRNSALARDTAMGPLLTFASPTLEAKYAAWHHAGQVPVDLALIVILIFSQVAWIVRWSFDQSLILSAVMFALISFNVLYMLGVWLFPKVYTHHRDWLCTVLFLVHKVAQMIVTATPGAGTIYSPTYNATVALLESSSFAQVMMLSMGAKARFKYQMPTLLVMLVLSVSLNGPICSAAFPNVSPGICMPGMLAFQTVACAAFPGALVYALERRARRIFVSSALA